MFNFFKKPELDEPDPNEQSVIVEIGLESDEQFGTKTERKIVSELEAQLEELIGVENEFDGHDFGEGHAILYMYGPSADAIWAAIEGALRSSEFKLIKATLRYGPATDSDAKTKEFRL